MRAIWPELAGIALSVALAACDVGGKGAPTGIPATPTATPVETPSPTSTPRLADIDGVPVEALEIGEATDFPEDVALVISTGCWQCDGPTTGLERVYRNPTGEIVVETLFTPEKVGLPPRVIQTDKGPQEDEPTMNGFALTPDGGRIVVSVCTRGGCLEMGGPPGPDAETTLFESRDGGVTWKRIEVLKGGFGARAITDEGVLLWDFSTTIVEGDGERLLYQLYPSRNVVESPAGTTGWRSISTPEGEVVWPTKDGRLLRSDGSEYLALDLPGGGEITSVQRGPGEGAPTFVTFFEPEEGGSQGGEYLVLLGPDGSVRRAYSLPGLVLLGGVFGPLLVYGNAGVEAEQLPVPPPRFYVGWLPVALDAENGKAAPILDPFLDRPGRNLVSAVVEGPFARVTGTSGCVNVRALPGAGAAVLECVAEGALLMLNRGLEDERTEGGVTWVHVVTPAGADGWASGEHLQR